MGKKRGNVADGVKTVYQVHETPEAIQSLRQSKIRQFFFEAIGAFAMIAISSCTGCFGWRTGAPSGIL
jgi:ABC-type multidrug transport system permease subunit